MVFTYFKSKLGCYEFLCNEMLRISLEEFNKVKQQLLSINDYFERIIFSVKIKVEILKQCSSLFSFATSLFLEQDNAVQEIKKDIFSKGYKIREIFLSTDIDSSKFKNCDDVTHIIKMVDWISKGCAEEWSKLENKKSVDSILNDFIECMYILKKHFYKEKYL